MPLTEIFPAAASLSVTGKTPRPSPFSIRLSADERARLAVEAAGAPLGAFIKSKVLGTALVERKGRKVLTIKDREALAQALALLGRSHLSNNLNQIAKAANIGTLPLTPETEAELLAAIQDVRSLRTLLMHALGLKPEVLE